MLLSKNKKIIVYLFLFIFLGSTNNKYLNHYRIFDLKNLKLYGLNKVEKKNLLLQLEEIKNENIFLLSKEKIIRILNSNDLIESFIVRKNYPSDLDIFIKKTSFVANIKIEEDNFLIGSNKKLIKSNLIYQNLPFVFGSPTIEDFFLIRNNILESSINFKDIKKLHFFPSKRWNLELKNGVLLKLPINGPLDALNDYSKIMSLPQFNNINVFDMRVKKQIIIDET